MRSIRLCLLLLASALALHTALQSASARPGSTQDALEAQIDEAERLVAEGSFGAALKRYRAIDPADLDVERARWVRFRLADLDWRDAPSRGDQSRIDAARLALAALAPLETEPAARDRVWAEAQASLGDSIWSRRRNWNMDEAYPHYVRALDWWGRSSDLELARERWLDVFWGMARPAWAPGAFFGNYGRDGIDQVLVEQALSLARDEQERGHARFALAQLLLGRSEEPRIEARAIELLEAIAAQSTEIEVHDDALFALAEHHVSPGVYGRSESGEWQRSTDFEQALFWYERILEDYAKGKSGVLERARERRDWILEPEVEVWSPGVFLPDSEFGFGIAWRNASSARLTLRRFELDRDLVIESGSDWVDSLDGARLPLVAEWSIDLERRHGTTSRMERLELDESLPRGAYLLEATIDGATARTTLLSTDLSIVLAGTGRDLIAWVVNASTGEPVEGATVLCLHHGRDSDPDPARIRDAEAVATDADGLARITLEPDARSVMVVARHDEDQALTSSWVSGVGERERFKALAATDRPAYRPGQVVSWSLLARDWVDDAWRASSGELRIEITGPRGDQVRSEEHPVSAFGSISGTLETETEWALGAYRLSLWRGDTQLASTRLFQLEEYRLPDFRVTVESPRSDDGLLQTFVLGDAVDITIAAATYAGAPVAGADVEVVVRRKPWDFEIDGIAPYPWFDGVGRAMPWNGYYGRMEEVGRYSLVSDAEGRTGLALETSVFDTNGWEYELEVRVTDAMRREVQGRGTVRVGEHAFAAAVDLEHRIVAPGTPLEASVRTRDANDHPVSVAGEFQLIRVTTLSREVFEARYGADAVPSPETPIEEEQLIERFEVTTDGEGQAVWRPTPPVEGTYVVRFEAFDERSEDRVVGAARGHVADEATRGIGIRAAGLELVLDSTTVGEGQEAAVILLSDRGGRPVLFTSAANGRVDVQVIRMDGVAKLVRVPIEGRHVPTVTLRASTVDGGQLFTDQDTLSVPPLSRVLNLDAQLASDVFMPGEAAAFDLRVTDHDGRPVSTELSLALFDEAVTAIRPESTPDPRRWFYERGVPFSETRDSSLGDELHDVFTWVELEDGGEGTLRGLLPSRARGLGYFDDDFNAVIGFGGSAGGKYGARSSLRELGYLADGPASPAVGSVLEAEGALDTDSGRDAPSDPPAANIRTDFRETAVWDPAVRTDDDGRARVEFVFPESLTSWRLVAIANDGGARFGIERSTPARTNLPLLLRLATPRFLVDGDEATFTTLVRNDTAEPVTARVSLVLEGAEVMGLVGDVDPVLALEPGSEATLDWRVRTTGAGAVRVLAGVTAGEVSDGVERVLPVLEHGLEVRIAASGRLDGERDRLSLDLPPARPGETEVAVIVTPSLASTAIEALPYLADYPYGCLEQTLSRFVPTAITLRALSELGFDRAEVARVAFDRPTTLRPSNDAERTLEEVDRMASEGLARVLSMQTGDGGFSWWPGGSSNTFMSAYASWSLSLAGEAGLDVPTGALERARRYLIGRLPELVERDLELAAWVLHAIQAVDARLGSEAEDVDDYFGRVYERREALGAYGRALMLLVAHGLGLEEERDVLLRNLENGVILEDGPGGGLVQPDAATVGRRTARWGEDGIGHRWSQDGVEATATSLRALLAVDPDHELVEPAIEWLVLERRGSAWKSTRDTAVCVLSLIDAVVKRGELDGSGEFRLLVDGEQRRSGTVPVGIEALMPVTWPLGDLGAGEHEFVLERTGGAGALYWSVQARAFSIEERIRPRANEIAVRRDVQRLAGRDTLLAGKLFDRVPVADGDRVESGERFEVVLTIETRAALEYLAIEDWKPAGFEAVDILSGGGARLRELRTDEVERRFGDGLNSLETLGDSLPVTSDGYTGRSEWVYRELRDTRVLHFADRLPAGVWELRTTLRAETPGTFHALPATVHAMYAPDLAGNSWELSVEIDG